MESTKATVKGHGLSVDDKVNFHGMANDSFPATDPTLCVLGKAGNKYTLTSVNDMDSTGKPWVWTFGAAAAFWASPVEKVHMDTEHGPTAHSAGCGVEVSDRYISSDRSKVTCGDCLAMPVSDDHDFESHSRRPWQCRTCKRVRAQHVAPVETPQVEEIVSEAHSLIGACVEYYLGDVTDASPDASGRTQGAVTGVDSYGRLAVANADGDTIHILPVTAVLVIAEPEMPATGRHAIPTNTPDVAGYHWQRYVLPGDYVTALSTYQLVAAGSNGCQVAATVKYVKDGMWQATGCVWMSTGLTEGYWQGESLADAFAHVVQYMTWVASVRGSGLTWADINRLDWRTPYVAPGVSEGECAAVAAADLNLGIVGYSKKGLPIFRNVLQPGRSLVTGRMVGVDAMVKPMSNATADVLIGPESHAADHVMEYGTDWTFCQTCGRYVIHTPRFSKPLSPPVRSKLAKRARKASKRHAFAGKR